MDNLSDQHLKPFKILCKKGIVADSWHTQVLQMLKDKVQHCKKISLSKCFECDGRLLYLDRLLVPDYSELRRNNYTLKRTILLYLHNKALQLQLFC